MPEQVNQESLITGIFDILMQNGEWLMNIDIDGADPKVALSLANAIATEFMANITHSVFMNWKFEDVDLEICEYCGEPSIGSDYTNKNICEGCLKRRAR